VLCSQVLLELWIGVGEDILPQFHQSFAQLVVRTACYLILLLLLTQHMVQQRYAELQTAAFVESPFHL